MKFDMKLSLEISFGNIFKFKVDRPSQAIGTLNLNAEFKNKGVEKPTMTCESLEKR